MLDNWAAYGLKYVVAPLYTKPVFEALVDANGSQLVTVELVNVETAIICGQMTTVQLPEVPVVTGI